MSGYYNLMILAGYGIVFFTVTMLAARWHSRSRSAMHTSQPEKRK